MKYNIIAPSCRPPASWGLPVEFMGAIFDADQGSINHEGTHLWMDRAMGSLFDISYPYNTAAARAQGKGIYYGNYYEEKAQYDPF